MYTNLQGLKAGNRGKAGSGVRERYCKGKQISRGDKHVHYLDCGEDLITCLTNLLNLIKLSI